jgi:hypothetical protein
MYTVRKLRGDIETQPSIRNWCCLVLHRLAIMVRHPDARPDFYGRIAALPSSQLQEFGVRCWIIR